MSFAPCRKAAAFCFYALLTDGTILPLLGGKDLTGFAAEICDKLHRMSSAGFFALGMKQPGRRGGFTQGGGAAGQGSPPRGGGGWAAPREWRAAFCATREGLGRAGGGGIKTQTGGALFPAWLHLFLLTWLLFAVAGALLPGCRAIICLNGAAGSGRFCLLRF